MLGLVRNFSGQQNRFCGLLAGAAGSCAACCALQQRLARDARLETKRLTCFAGLCETAVPVYAGGKLLAFLHTGQVLLQPPTRRQFNHVASLLRKWEARLDLKSVEEAYFQTPVFAPRKYDSLTRLLALPPGSARGHSCPQQHSMIALARRVVCRTWLRTGMSARRWQCPHAPRAALKSGRSPEIRNPKAEGRKKAEYRKPSMA